MSRELTTTNAVIDALGGTKKVAILTGRPDQAVSNWRRRGFPPETFIVLTDALNAIECIAPSELWSMVVSQTPGEVVQVES